MNSPLHQRALLVAALCCGPALVARGADATGASAVTGVPTTAVVVSSPCEISSAGTTSALLAAADSGSGGFVPMLLAANAPAASTSGGVLRPPLNLGSDINYESDRLVNLPDGETVLSGNVDVHMGESELQSDQLVYDRNTNSISATGKVRFRDPTVEVQGDTGRYSDTGAQFNQAQFQFMKLPGYGRADQIAMTPAKVVTLKNVTYTTCPRPRADWLLRAHELKLDTVAGVGVGRGAVIRFEGVPILYVPWISFPLSDARKSGFLFPDLSTSSRSGVLVAVPWYWNIAPNQDATFTPRYYSRRGFDMGVEYRFLSAINSGSIDANYLNHDQAYETELKAPYLLTNPSYSPPADRSYLRLIDRLLLPGNTRVDTHVQAVSDTEYFEDFSQGSQATSTPFLARDLTISHRDDIWNLRGELLGFQTLDSTLPDYARPYTQLPRLTAAALWSPQRLPALDFSFDSEVADFTRDCHLTSSGGLPGPCLAPTTGLTSPWPAGTAVNGWRLDGKPQIGLDLSGPGYFFRPSAAWEFTQYELRDTTTPGNSPQRSLPILSVDTGLEFERLSGSNGIRSLTLEPRLMYTYIPYRDQSELPLFDSASPDLNLIELFRPNRYVGIDRVGDANELTMGVTSQMFESASGVRYLSATIGQALYLDRPRVTLPDATGTAGTTSSSLIAETNLTAYKHWNLQLNVASNPAVSRVDEAEVILQYLASSRQVANLSYRYLYGQLQQIDGSEAWTVGGHWQLYARAVYSLRGEQSIEDFAGFQYRGACWSVRLVGQRSVARSISSGTTSSTQYDTGVMLQVELTGLSNVGSGVGTGGGLTTFLEQSIRGYSATAAKP